MKCPNCNSDREPLVIEEFEKFNEVIRQYYKRGDYVECVRCGFHYERKFSKHGEYLGVK